MTTVLNVLRFLGFLVVYGVWIGLSGWALQRIMRGKMWPTYFVGALFWLVPPAILFLLTGRGDATFLLLTGAALPFMFLLGFLVRRFYGAQWQLVATLYRIGSTLGARQGWRGCISQILTALVMLAYPILVGIWFFGGDTSGNRERIIQATFVLFVYLYFADIGTVLMLASPDTPPNAHSFLLWNRILGLLPAGLMLAMILASLGDGKGPAGADIRVIGGLLAALLLLSVVPYLIGWVRSRNRRLRGIADRPRPARGAGAAR
ncbi:MAG TPA: hypothetical protein DGT23_26155, partial [Micromonosporaceae bacterium]|nr:hypothetical protein [Micromonosporaceae bacterium]